MGFCAVCGGSPGNGDPDCEACHGEGDWVLMQCPHKEIEPQIGQFIMLADFARDGRFPVAGGVLDQSDSFLSACREFWHFLNLMSEPNG